jgi:hypothetical protein
MAGGKYDSVIGCQLCKKILAKYVAYDPHTYILDGICPVLDGFDLLATTPTGSGKMGYLILLMLIVREIAANTALGRDSDASPTSKTRSRVNPPMSFFNRVISSSRNRTCA